MRQDWLDGTISELIIFSRAFNNDDRKSVGKYLGQERGIKVQ